MLPTVRSSNEIQAITTIREQHIGFDSNVRMQTPSCWAAPRPGINMAELFAASDSFWTVMIRWGALESRGISSVWSLLNFCIVVVVLTTSYTYLAIYQISAHFSGVLCFVHYELQGPTCKARLYAIPFGPLWFGCIVLLLKASPNKKWTRSIMAYIDCNRSVNVRVASQATDTAYSSWQERL